jgi:hypothetical protein
MYDRGDFLPPVGEAGQGSRERRSSVIRLFRGAILLLAAASVIGAAACSGSDHAAAPATSGAGFQPAANDEFAQAARGICPEEWKEQYEAWSRRVGMTVYCPTWMPGPLEGEISRDYAVRVPARNGWQLGWAWLEFGDLVHVVFEGYRAKDFPPTCEGKPCFAGRAGTSRVGRFRVVWYLKNRASHTGHVAAIVPQGKDVYVYSMHVAPPSGTVAKTEANLKHVIRDLVPVTAG